MTILQCYFLKVENIKMFEYMIYNEIERDNGAFLTLVK